MEATETLLDFVNTRADAGGRAELFGSGADLAAWATGRGLLGDGVVVTDGDAASARELRDALVSVLLAHNGADDGGVDEAERYLLQAGARYPLATVLTAGGARVAAESQGVPGVFGAVLAAATEIALREEWGRIKACANPPCHFGFVDRTRNRAGRFCSPACASQVSVRAYRARRRQD